MKKFLKIKTIVFIYYGTQNDEMKHVVCFCTAVIDWGFSFFCCFVSVHISQIHNQRNLIDVKLYYKYVTKAGNFNDTLILYCSKY